jgi:uncharacterized membrane protein
MNDTSLSGMAPSRTSRFRQHFVTGLLVLAPLWLTGYVVVLVVRYLGGYLSPYLREIAVRALGESHPAALVTVAADVVSFVVTVLLITLVGLAVGRVMGQRAVELLSALLSRIPVVREVYNGVRRFGAMLAGDKSNLRRVVAVRFPYEHAWRIGFVTSEREWPFPEENGDPHTAVFVPGTPNPTSGFLIFYPPQDVIPLSLSVDEALKLIVTGGTLTPERLSSQES